MARIAFSVLSKSGASPITRAIRNCQVPLWRADTKPTPPRNITVESGSGLSADFDLKEYSRPLIESVNRELHKLIPLSEEKIEEEALPVACALEMIHAASLILDDLPCMDNDHLRLGRPSTHFVFGEGVAIRASDALCALAFHHIARPCDALRPDRALKVVYELAKGGGSMGMVGGQYMDLASAGTPSVDPALVEVGGGSDEEVERLRAYGRGVGLAYQIVDDMLDQSSTTEELGKTAGKDKRADKATYPKLYGMQKCREIVLQLAQEAQQCISQFNPLQAAPLLTFAQYVIARNF